MAKLRSLAFPVTHHPNRIKFPEKTVDPIYNSEEYGIWRTHIIARAGGQCEAIDAHGYRCTNAKPDHRVYADHVVELRDGGAPFDPSNGQCLCAMHHTNKTLAMRARRHCS